MKKIALVTGASSGIGKEFVLQYDKLNSRSHHALFDEIWVVARRKERLMELQQCCNTPVAVFALDLCKTESVDVITEQLKQQQCTITCLICNAGFGRVGSYADISRNDALQLIDLNCRSLVDLTNACIPYMAMDSHLVHVASMVAFLPLSYMNIYASTKAFVYHYSRALRVELKPQKIAVTAVCPYWVKDSEFIDSSKQSKDASYVQFYKGADTTRDVVARSIRDIQKNKAVSTPSRVAKLMHFITKLVPVSVLLWGWEHIRKG